MGLHLASGCFPGLNSEFKLIKPFIMVRDLRLDLGKHVSDSVCQRLLDIWRNAGGHFNRQFFVINMEVIMC